MAEKNKHQSNGKFNRFARLSGIGFQMGATIFLGAILGKYLDERYPSTKKWLTIGCTLLAVAIALYTVLRQVNQLNKEDEE
jgi:F0F1-type ATP synthase assembly protein I